MEKVNDIFIITSNPEFSSLCIDELVKIDNKVRVVASLEPGVFAIKCSIDRETFQQRLLESNMIFLRHINSVDYTFDITGTRDDFDLFQSCINNYGADDFSQRDVAVHIRRSGKDKEYSLLDLKEKIDADIVSQFKANPVIKDGEIIVSVYLTDSKGYFGISPVKYNLSSWRGGMHHYKISDSDISRAKYKLVEAIERFNIDMSNIRSALDLGAAPGGWTSVLLEYGVRVTAVDTGDLDNRLLDNGNVDFIKANASEVDLGNRSFDMITCDMSWNPLNTVNMLLKYKDNLKQGGLIVFTLKLMHANVWKTIREIEKSLKEDFTIVSSKHLFHNRREITMLLKKY